MQTEILQTFSEQVTATHRYVQEMWPRLTRRDDPKEKDRLVVPEPYVVPSLEQFPHLFYWDSYFTLVGLVSDGHGVLARQIVDNFLYQIERYKTTMNYTAGEGTQRSQPPYLSSMIAEVYKLRGNRHWLYHAYQMLRKEYQEVWMKTHKDEKTGLSRYVDPAAPDDPRRSIYESGWDFSSRWGGRPLQLAPVDLNSNLYLYEMNLARLARLLELKHEGNRWERAAGERAAWMRERFFDPQEGLFGDYDLQKKKISPRWSVATFSPLFAGLATPQQAVQVVANLSRFETDFGLLTTPQRYGDDWGQWDTPNGWAPLHWIAVSGLRRYGYFEEAARIVRKWLTLNAAEQARTGKMWEKYDVVAGNADAISPDYPQQHGFGWTNGVYSALLGRTIGGLDYDLAGKQIVIEPLFSRTLAGTSCHAVYHNYLSAELTLQWNMAADGRGIRLRVQAAPTLQKVQVRLRDETGLPGQAWLNGQPITLEREESVYRRLTLTLTDLKTFDLVWNSAGQKP